MHLVKFWRLMAPFFMVGYGDVVHVENGKKRRVVKISRKVEYSFCSYHPKYLTRPVHHNKPCFMGRALTILPQMSHVDAKIEGFA